MDIAELTRRMLDFVRSKGFYDEASPRPQTSRNLAISLVLEANEVLEHFQWAEDLKDKQAFASELADVALYLMQLASLNDIDLETAILEKLALNRERQWS